MKSGDTVADNLTKRHYRLMYRFKPACCPADVHKGSRDIPGGHLPGTWGANGVLNELPRVERWLVQELVSELVEDRLGHEVIQHRAVMAFDESHLSLVRER